MEDLENHALQKYLKEARYSQLGSIKNNRRCLRLLNEIDEQEFLIGERDRSWLQLERIALSSPIFEQ
jgi:hypothetical protein